MMFKNIYKYAKTFLSLLLVLIEGLWLRRLISGHEIDINLEVVICMKKRNPISRLKNLDFYVKILYLIPSSECFCGVHRKIIQEMIRD